VKHYSNLTLQFLLFIGPSPQGTKPLVLAVVLLNRDVVRCVSYSYNM